MHLIPSSNAQTNLDHFLVTEDGKYLNINIVLRGFLTEITELCDVTIGMEDAEVGLMEYYHRILTPLFNDVENILSLIQSVTKTT